MESCLQTKQMQSLTVPVKGLKKFCWNAKEAKAFSALSIAIIISLTSYGLLLLHLPVNLLVIHL